MNIKYDVESNVMQIDDIDLYPENLDRNFIGICKSCNSDVTSISYHVHDSGMVVAGKCTSCDIIYAIFYDTEWNWQGEETILDFFNINNSSNIKFLDNIDQKKLETVFTPAETKAMYAKARGEKYVRQYLYRARKKYNDFYELFGIQINI
ncbi:hypothetical protein SAMN04488589_2089 [Methanolobus vulcani]|jgi:hypothetical protein|uniref:Uncharacterized protein n=1 Tax=Methanolobus vulcani TaxID=38026 RepID=A0A7Z7B0C6_9EURY|nr:hypothetical protein [Methanolobus vulcani]SDG06249.1 hypothetical protein SAMN04488589_2089 [Methanolobus vulcani]